MMAYEEDFLGRQVMAWLRCSRIVAFYRMHAAAGPDIRTDSGRNGIRVAGAYAGCP